MTAQDFILQLDEAADGLTAITIRLMLRLMAISIRTGSRDVVASDRWLHRELGTSQRGLTAAKRQVARLLNVQIRDCAMTIYRLPSELAVQVNAEIFSTSALFSRTELDADGAQPVSGSRTELDADGAQPVRGSRTVCTRHAHSLYAAGAQSYARGAQSVRDTRTVSTQNQQVSADGADIESSRSFSITEVSGIDLDRVASAKVVESSLRADASELRDHLYGFMQSRGPENRDRAYPDQEILAKCLAVASLCEITAILERLKADDRPCGRLYAWFIPTLLDKRHQIPASVWKSYYATWKFRNAGKQKSGKQFTDDLVNQAARNQRKMA